jgi:hypothetical protein
LENGKKNVQWLLFVFSFFLFSCGNSGNGNGCKSIDTVEQLAQIAGETGEDACYRITSDLDLSSSDQSWLPIGSLESPFQGDIYGGGHVISDLRIQDSSSSYLAFIAATGEDSHIEKLSFASCIVEGENYLAAVVARNEGILREVDADCEIHSHLQGNYIGGLVADNRGKIYQSRASVVLSGGNYLGGIVGINRAEIDRSMNNEASIDGAEYLGAIAGENTGSIIISSAEGGIRGSNFLGGLVGLNTGSIRSSYASGEVNTSTDSAFIGGFVGSNRGFIEYSYTIATATSETQINGFAGENLGNILEGYWDSDISGVHTDTIAGTTALTTEQMQCPESKNDQNCDLVYRNWSADIWDFLTHLEYPTHR